MTVSTISSAVHITPVAIKTFFAHGKRRAQKYKNGDTGEDAKDDIFFDEAFHIVKAFIEMGTRNTIESLQAFTNTHVPAPYWASVSPVRIPLSSCNQAADILIDWFGPEELKQVVGGERWWQVRGLDGVDGEWITEADYLSDLNVKNDKNISKDDQNILRMMHLDRVMISKYSVLLKIIAGGYCWGSINTHRYQIIRYARKFRGRAFAVNYRKAPQYPWPCPLQDVLAAYLFLIRPPPHALHRAISPSKVVFAGDSAGGGLALTVLTILRDMGLPSPAGAVLISPWVDLTHSFPSVMNNVDTDIIPSHGFLAKPSTLWPVDLVPPKGGRIQPTKSKTPPEPGHADTLKSSVSCLQHEQRRNEQLQSDAPNAHITDQGRHGEGDLSKGLLHDDFQPKPPKVLMDNKGDVPLEIKSQIQLYATTEQLTHPSVSPVLQGSLGNLPPLYILAGDGEVLRDEIIYLAHRAACPSEYPVRDGVTKDSTRQSSNSKNFTTPTKVHLQVFDGMCHVLTVFSFTDSAKYAYRSIAEFVRHVTDDDEAHLNRNPFPELHRPVSSVWSHDYELDPHRRKRGSRFSRMKKTSGPPETQSADNIVDINMYKEGADIPGITMIRQRVDILGKTRPMEEKEEIPALRIRPEEIGLVREAPAIRWVKGQEEWDATFKKSAQKAIRQRRTLEAKASTLIERAKQQGLVLHSGGSDISPKSHAIRVSHVKSTSDHPIDGTIQKDRRWGPFDLDDETPPPSAISGRRDTPEALALLKKCIYHTAPVTHETVPKLSAKDALRAAFDPHDDPTRPPRQSVSEQQVRTHVIPIHGLRLWDALVGYFMRESSKKASDGTKHAAAAIRDTGANIGIR
ncbi:alpha/beta-hydrolase [Armillaria mellea]|nr:alpha/beta-hydrolase [Armillaria mellea]